MRKSPTTRVQDRRTRALRALGVCGAVRPMGRHEWLCLRLANHRYDHHSFVNVTDPMMPRFLVSAITGTCHSRVTGTTPERVTPQ